jgi:hypothetical protein
MGAKKLTAWWVANFSLVSPTAANFNLPLRNCLHLRTDYKKGPSCDLMMGVAEKHEIRNTNMQTARIGGVTLLKPLPVARPFASIDIISFSTMMKKE